MSPASQDFDSQADSGCLRAGAEKQNKGTSEQEDLMQPICSDGK